MEYFLDQIKLVLPTVGISFLISTIQINKNLPKESIQDEKIYKLKGDRFNAKMTETNKGFIVKKYSEANSIVHPSISKGWIKQRDKLKAINILILKNGKYIFNEDTVFSSSSAASSVILGRNSPGPSVWIDETGRSLKENELKSN